MVWTADNVQQIEASPEDVGLSSAGMAPGECSPLD
jgi:hypothetical protein